MPSPIDLGTIAGKVRECCVSSRPPRPRFFLLPPFLFAAAAAAAAAGLLVCRSPSPELPSVLTAPSPTHSQVEAGMYTSLDAFASDVRRIAMNCELLYGGGIHSRPDIVAEASALVYRFESMLAAGNAFGLTSAVRDRRLARGVCARARARVLSVRRMHPAPTLSHFYRSRVSLSLSSPLPPRLHTTRRRARARRRRHLPRSQCSFVSMVRGALRIFSFPGTSTRRCSSDGKRGSIISYLRNTNEDQLLVPTFCTTPSHSPHTAGVSAPSACRGIWMTHSRASFRSFILFRI